MLSTAAMPFMTLAQHGAEHAPAHDVVEALKLPLAKATEGMGWAGLILLLPLLSLVLCGFCAAFKVRTKAPAWITVALLGASFATTVALFAQYTEPVTIHLMDWFRMSWGDGDHSGFTAHFSLYVDRLTLLWMLFVTGLGTLIALYASEYMESDVGGGYTRFFAGVSVFLCAMSCLVMGDNLVMLYLGWEGVGFASYWLIGYYYQKPSAVAAAKKAFIVNRIGDVGLALGLYLTYQYFGTVQYAEIFSQLQGHEDAARHAIAGGWQVKAIPFLLMIGAFGKSAQLPLYVWLPDAMEGPTPVSALIHAATMVTAGVFLLIRMFPLMELHPAALPTVAWIGGLTALFAATIGMAQYDIKRIMAYSTVSQLGYMFMGVGTLTAFAGAYHVFTHAFFKALLFLTCGAVMHGFAGQLDLRKLSGLRHMTGWKIVSYTMLVGCLCLVGFPGTSGFFSKDLIMAQPFITDGPGYMWLGGIGILTAVLTAYYTFRVWFRVCAGPVKFEMGDDHHGDDHADDGAHDGHDDHGGHDKPHAPRFAINLVLMVLAVGALAAAALKFVGGDNEHPGWVESMIADSTAINGVPGHDHVYDTWIADPHHWMMVVAIASTIIGMTVAWYLHLKNRAAADALKAKLPTVLVRAAENKWYVDEFYHGLIRLPLWGIGLAMATFDLWFIDKFLVNGVARLTRELGRRFQPLQNGILQSYAVSMAGGLGLVALLVLYMQEIITLMGRLFGGEG